MGELPLCGLSLYERMAATGLLRPHSLGEDFGETPDLRSLGDDLGEALGETLGETLGESLL